MSLPLITNVDGSTTRVTAHGDKTVLSDQTKCGQENKALTQTDQCLVLESLNRSSEGQRKFQVVIAHF